MVLCGCQADESKNILQNQIENADISESSSTDAVSEEAKPVTIDTDKADTEDIGAIAKESAGPESALESDETTKPSTDIQGSEALWGTFTPDTAENDYVQAVMKTREFTSGTRTQTYEADYDGNGRKEAFVFCGEYEDGEFVGDLWFVDENLSASCLEEDMYAARTDGSRGVGNHPGNLG